MEELAWTVTLADDHPVILRGLEELIDSVPDLRVVAVSADGETAETEIRLKQPDVAVLDIHMPKKSGIEVLRSVNRDRLRTRVILLTASLSERLLLDAIRLGAFGIALKESEPDTLIECFTEVARGNRWLQPELAKRAEDASNHGAGAIGTDRLTAREVEIMELVAEGRANKNIAERIAISEGTVKIHLHNIYQKLGIANRTELAAMSLNHRLNI